MAKWLAASTGLLLSAPIIAGATTMKDSTELKIGERAKSFVQLIANGKTILASPKEGLWSIATDWSDGWPDKWKHGDPEKTENAGDWTIISGKLELPSGTMLVRDAYRTENGMVKGIRRWTWTGDRTLEKCTLSIRFQAPGATHAKPMMPGVVVYGNPAGEKTGNHAVTVHSGKPGDKTFFEEHRFAAPWESIEWKDGDVYRAAALHTVPSPAYGAHQNDQWWTLGIIAGSDSTELASLSGPTAANGKNSVAKALQGRFLEYPDTWLNLPPGAVVEKTFYLQAVPETAKGSGFRPPMRTSMDLYPVGVEGLPGYEETIKDKCRFAMSRYRDRANDPGFEMYPDYIKGTHFVMGWCGQAEAGAYGMLGLSRRIGDPQMIVRGQKALDWLSQSPFNDKGFMLIYEAESGKWSGQDPVSQGQAMETFARAIALGRQMKGVKTERWEKFLKQACKVQAERILNESWKPVNTAEAFFISPLCKASVLFGDAQFRKAAVRAGEYYANRHLDMEEPYWGGTLDANCEDKEGAWAGFQAFVALYELTKEKKYLVWAEHAMDVTLSYTVLWDIDLPAGRLRDHMLKTRGWTIVSAQNQHLDVFGVVFTPEIWRMGIYLKRPDLMRLAAAMYRSCGQMMDPFGSTGEQIQHTNFAQHGDMSNVFRLRGGYSEGWTVFWITAHFLNAATEFERMGIDLDQVDKAIIKSLKSKKGG